MTKTITIRVTAKDIKNGNKADCCLCPVALAMRRVIPYCQVHSKVFNVPLNFHDYPLPKKVQAWIERFDRGWGRVKPFSFKIKL